MLLILVFIFLEQMSGERPLILHVSHLFFSDVLLFAFLGPIVETGPLLLFAVSQCTCTCRPFARIPVTFHHVNAQEGLSINFHGELSQDESALFNSQLNLPMVLFAIVGVVGE
jgi:hypothetical protein